MREWDRYPLGVKTLLYALIRVAEHIPVVRGIDPGTHGEVHTAVGEFYKADKERRILQYPLIRPDDLLNNTLGP